MCLVSSKRINDLLWFWLKNKAYIVPCSFHFLGPCIWLAGSFVRVLQTACFCTAWCNKLTSKKLVDCIFLFFTPFHFPFLFSTLFFMPPVLLKVPIFCDYIPVIIYHIIKLACMLAVLLKDSNLKMMCTYDQSNIVTLLFVTEWTILNNLLIQTINKSFTLFIVTAWFGAVPWSWNHWI